MAERSNNRDGLSPQGLACYNRVQGGTYMSRFDQAKMLMRVKKIQKELEKQIITVEKGNGAVSVEITGEQKLKKIRIDPSSIDLDDIGQLEHWIEEAVREAISESQRIAAEKMQPMMGALGNLGL
jgi:DNA-binding YbaB/EbfC family protein